MSRVCTFLMYVSILTACGVPPVAEPDPKTVLVYVCVKDNARTEVKDPSLCPPNTTIIETVMKYACPDETIVDQPTQCARLCLEGYAYEETSGRCLKVCPAGQTVNPAGTACVGQPGRHTVSVREPNGGIPLIVEVSAGTRANAFPLVMQNNERSMRLEDIRFLAYVGVEQDGIVPDPSEWLSTQTDVAQYLGPCLLIEQVMGHAAGPVEVDRVPLSDQAMVFFPEAVGTGTAITLAVLCDLKPAHVAYHVALVLDAVSLVDAETGEPIPSTEVAFDGLNRNFDYRVRAAPLPACPPPVLAIGAPNSPPEPNATSIEVLQFEVIADPSCRDLKTWSVQYTVIDNGWYTVPSAIRITDSRDPSRPLFPNIQTTAIAGDFTFLAQEPADNATTIPAAHPLVLRMEIDTHQSTGSGNDTVRVDVVGFCYRDPAADVEACLDQSSVLIAGETVTF